MRANVAVSAANIDANLRRVIRTPVPVGPRQAEQSGLRVFAKLRLPIALERKLQRQLSNPRRTRAVVGSTVDGSKPGAFHARRRIV